MPYIITVLSFVVIGVGFTLFNTQDQSLVTENTNVIAIQESADTEFTDSVSGFKEDFRNLLDSTIESATKTIAVGIAEIKTSTQTPVINTPTQAAQQENLPPKAQVVLTNTPILTDYKNGTYSKQVTYRTPDGTYNMNISITISNDIVTNSSVAFDARGARDSYSRRFLKSYPSQVDGKDFTNVNLSRVGGASLTTAAFNEALVKIKTKAAS